MQEEMVNPIFKRLLLAIHLGMLSATAALSASAIDLKGIPLGISLEDFRVIQHPDGIQNTNVICSNDEDLNSYQAYPFKGGEALSAAGVVRCVFGGGRDPDTTSLGIIPLSIGDSDFAARSYEFRFASAIKDEDPHLYEIELQTSSEARRYLVDALVGRWGTTSSHIIGNTTTAKKTTVHGEYYEWSDGQFSVSVDIPWSKADEMIIIYRDSVIATIVGQRIVDPE
jgi:hypothetical protein